MKLGIFVNRSIYLPASARESSMLALGILWLYLIIRQIADPGFTYYWGYMVVQITATIIILIALEIHFRAEGGLSWLTYIVTTLATWADTLGTAGNMYSRYSAYDKIVHFGGGVAITAVAADLLFAFRRKHGLAKQFRRTFFIAALISMSLNIGWEIYEYLGDRVFSTGRHAGWIDTTYDLICDSLGTIVALVLLSFIEPRRFDRDNQPHAAGPTAPRLVPHRANGSPSRVDPRGRRQSTRRRLMTGYLLPILFVPLVWIDAAFTAGYSHVSDTVSDLAEQERPHAFVMRLGMIGCAGLLAIFTSGLLRVLPRHRRAIGVELFGASLTMALAGVFQDWGPDPGGDRNLEGFLHLTAASVMIGLFLSAIITIAIAVNDVTIPGAWAALFRPSIAYALVLGASGVLFVFGPNRIEGLAQRAIFFSAIAWLVTLTSVALRAASTDEHESSRLPETISPRTSDRSVLTSAAG